MVVVSPLPRLVIDLDKIRYNAQILTALARQRGVEVMGVTKVTCAHPDAARALVAGGVSKLADSRLSNLARLRELNLGIPLYLLRLPGPSQAAEVVAVADGSLNSEPATLQALSQAAVAAGRRHKVVLMVDLGDLREGLWPDQVLETARWAAGLPGLELEGLGTNLTCYGGVIPTVENLGRLIELQRRVEAVVERPLPVLSGGNSSSLQMLLAGRLPAGVTQLRLGEGIMLGRETVARQPIPGAHLDAFRLEAEVLEVKEKPSVPIGEIGQDAFGGTPVFTDRGIHRRAICGLGRQDADLGGLVPVHRGVEVLGGSSDHLLLDVTRADPPVAVGDVLPFVPGYGALLAAMTSPYVAKVLR